MRSIFFLLVTAISINGTLAQDTTRVLFLGNSYTFFNDLPVILSEMAASMGHVVETAQNTPGGASLQGHISNSTSQDLIQAGNWDFVVLQEQSQKPSLPYDQVTADFFPAVEALVETIRLHNDCAVPLLYMTWGRENGDASNCSWHPPVCTYEGMQELLTERYLEAADNTESWCVPIGMVWEDLLNSTNINLYNADGSHPSAAGSYLAASAFFVALFGENPTDSNYSGPIGPGNSNSIDEAVWNVWQTQQSAWMQYDVLGYNLFAQSTPTGCNIQVSTSPYIDSILANTGDVEFVWQNGSLESLEFEGMTTLDLTVFSGCSAPLTSSQTFYASTSQASDLKEPNTLAFYPNPANDFLIAHGSRAQQAKLKMRDNQGRVAKSCDIGERETIDVTSIPAGIYTLEIWVSGTLLETSKVIIEH